MDGGIRKVIREQHGVISRDQALAFGMAADRIDELVHSGRWKSRHRGVYLVWKDKGFLTKLAAATLAADGIASHRSAAALLNMDGLDRCRVIEVKTTRRVDLEGVIVRRVKKIDPADVQVVNGIRVTTHLATLEDLGWVVHRDFVEMAMDFCLRHKKVTWEELDERVGKNSRRGAVGPAVLKAVLFLRSRQRQHTHSLLETLFLQLLRYALFPLPLLQYTVVHERGSNDVDFAWPDKDFIVETIGYKVHGASPDQFERDALRSRRIGSVRRFTVFPVTYADVHRKAPLLLAALAKALGVAWPPADAVLAEVNAFLDRINEPEEVTRAA